MLTRKPAVRRKSKTTAKRAPTKSLIVNRAVRKANPVKRADTSHTDRMLLEALNTAIDTARERKLKKDYSQVNGYLGYAQGLLKSLQLHKALDAETLKQYKSVIKGIAL